MSDLACPHRLLISSWATMSTAEAGPSRKSQQLNWIKFSKKLMFHILPGYRNIVGYIGMLLLFSAFSSFFFKEFYLVIKSGHCSYRRPLFGLQRHCLSDGSVWPVTAACLMYLAPEVWYYCMCIWVTHTVMPVQRLVDNSQEGVLSFHLQGVELRSSCGGTCL